MNNFDLIIFDCDGVLVDSESIANWVFSRILKETYGLSLNLDDMFRIFVGNSSARCMEIVEQMTGQKPSNDLDHRYKSEINQALASSVTAVEGIHKAIEALSIPYCVASSGSYEKMRITLTKTNLYQYFEGKLYSTADVDRGKPYPDVYLYAAKNMGVTEPSKCLVIEDSPIGVEGGVSAGMLVFGYAELMDRQRLLDAGAHHTFNSMDKLVDDIFSFEQLYFPAGN